VFLLRGWLRITFKSPSFVPIISERQAGEHDPAIGDLPTEIGNRRAAGER